MCSLKHWVWEGAGKQMCLPHPRLQGRHLTYVVSVTSHTQPARGHYQYTLTPNTRAPALQELCVFPKAPELKDDRARSPPPVLPHFAPSMEPILSQAAMPAHYPSGWRRKSLPILSSSSTWSLGTTQPSWTMSTCHHGWDSGIQPLQQCSRQGWKPGLAQHKLHKHTGSGQPGESGESLEPLWEPS